MRNRFKDPFLGHLGQRWLIKCIRDRVYQLYLDSGCKLASEIKEVKNDPVEPSTS